jgi:hypothetical protein
MQIGTADGARLEADQKPAIFNTPEFSPCLTHLKVELEAWQQDEWTHFGRKRRCSEATNCWR